MESQIDHATARALLEWHLDAGVDEAISDAPIDRYSLNSKPTAAKKPVSPALAHRPAEVDPVAEARGIAASATSLEGLALGMQGYNHCDLRESARKFVFCDGNANARIMIIGEAPGREEDIEGRPFVGRAGQMLDKMLAAIGLSRQAEKPENAVYITNVLPWRPPANRPPENHEVAMLLPFLERHIILADPDLIVLMGNTPCQALLGRAGITRIRGQWAEVLGKPALPMFHPAYLLRQPAAKREAWADLLTLRAKLNEKT